MFALYTDSFGNPPMQALHGVETQLAQGLVPGKWSRVSGSRAHTLTCTLLDPCTPYRADGRQQGEACSERRGAIFMGVRFNLVLMNGDILDSCAGEYFR